MLLTRTPRSRDRRGLLATAVAFTLLSPLFVAVPTAAAADLVPVVIDIAKIVDNPTVPRHAGEPVSYTITVTCSSTQSDCVNLVLTDAFPDPIVFDSVSAGTKYTSATVGNGFALTFIDPLDEGGVGLTAGDFVTIQANGHVTSALSADWNGDTVTNTAYATVDNPDSNNQSSADIVIEAPFVPRSDITKTITPSAATAFANTPIAFALSARNTSNASVDSLVIQDPAVPPTNAFDYVDVTGLSALTKPTPASLVLIEWWDGIGTWNTVDDDDNPDAAQPSANPTLTAARAGTALAGIKGLRFTFTDPGNIAPNATAGATISTSTTAAVEALSSPWTATNVASSHVIRGVDVGGTSTDSADYTLTPAAINLSAQKTFSTRDVIGGDDVVVTLTGQNGTDFDLSSLSITEPAPLTTSLADQGIEFLAWLQSDVSWPIGATSVAVEYTYTDAVPSSTSNWIVPNTLPAPTPGATVESFVVRFTGIMGDNANAVLPFNARTLAAPAANETTTDTIRVDGVATTGLIDEATALDTLTRRSARINTTITKNISPSTIFANAGTRVLVSLPSQVDPRPTSAETGGSTTGVESFVVTDVDPDFWNAFDAKSIVGTAVPLSSTLQVQYTTDGGGSWADLGAPVVGSTTVTTAINSSVGDIANGYRFVYTSTAGGLLAPGFNVQPNLRAALRADLRTGGPIVGLADRIVDNIATSRVENPLATPDFAESTDPATVTVRPLPAGGGPGFDTIEKDWNTLDVQSRSSDEADLTIRWGTAGLAFDSVVISDVADNSLDSSDDPSQATIATSVYEAFNLVRIPAITAVMDPLLVNDQVTAVQLFNGTTWVATASNPCAGTACQGTFPGYVLTTAERASTIGVRLIFAEKSSRVGPTASNPAAPELGSGVAATTGLDRTLNLVFAVRDYRRSDPTVAVLGDTRHALYNVAGSEGSVNNTASIDGRTTAPAVVLHQTDDSIIHILDSPINVIATKSWIDGPLGRPIPASNVPQANYPTARMTVTAQNASDVAVNTLTLVEPTGGTTPFDVVNLTRIEATAGTSASSMVTLERSGVADVPITLAAARALAPAALATVTKVTLSLDGRVPSTTTIGLILHTQLREFLRGTSIPVPLTTVPNEVTASVTDPGGLGDPGPASDNVVSGIATASIDIVEWSYSVTAQKTITADTTSAPTSAAIQYAGNSTKALVTLTGQPGGTARATQLVMTDISPTFWNAYNFDSLGPSGTSFVAPTDRVQIDLLMGKAGTHDGVEYDTSAGIVSSCDTDPALDPSCWVLGTPSATWVTPTLPSGFVKADIRGIRFTFTKADGSAWEQPYNPILTAGFTVERREYLVSPSTRLVPSTLFTFTTPAPGETVPGIFSNDVRVESSAVSRTTGLPLWSASADAEAQIRFQHLPARVTIKKSPYGSQSLGADIPFKMVVTNSGSAAAGAHDKPLGNLVITDAIPVEAAEPLLVFPKDPDTGARYDISVPAEAAAVISYRVADASNATQPTPAITAALGVIGATDQKLTFTVDPTWKLPVGWTLTITVRLQFKDQLDEGHMVINTATVTADQPFDTCDYYTDESTKEPQLLKVSECTSLTTVWPLPSAPVTIVKGVRGLDAGPLDASGDPILDGLGDPYDDLGILKTIPSSKVDCTAPNVTTAITNEYYRYPCVPITRPGGYEEWANTFTNGGNIGLTKLVAIDVLPTGGDKGVIVNEERGSKWTPILTSYPQLVNAPVGSDFDVYYVTDRTMVSTRCNGADIQNTLGMSPATSPAMTVGYQACLTSSANPDDLSERSAAWTLLDPATLDDAPILANIVALKFVLTMTHANPITPGMKVSFVYRSKTATSIDIAESAANLDRDSIAYNSIAAAAAGLDSGVEVPNRFVTEPRKVGVAMATGAIQLEKAVDGAAASYAPPSFNFNLGCTSVGDAFTPKNADGTSRATVAVTPGTSVLVAGLPLYADCSVSEGNYGQTSATISPSSLVAQAAETSNYTVFDPNPVFGASRPDIQVSTVTNTYDLARLVVTKAVSTTARTTEGGATAPDFNNFTINVTCTFNNGVTTSTVLSVTAQPLTASGTYTSPNLPAGSRCNVTESTTRSRSSIQQTFTSATGTSSSTSNTITGLVLTPNTTAAIPAATNLLEITNTFTSYSLTVNKVVVGAWAAAHDEGSFLVTVSCTRNTNGTTRTVFTGSATFTSPGALSHVFPNIATGATCVVSESAANAGGAAVSITQPAGTMTQARTATVTNTFNDANLTVTKRVHSTAVDGDGNPVYLDAPYAAAVSCTFGPSSTPVFGTGYSAGSPMTATFDAAGFTAARQQAVTFSGLPAGASCTVTETSATPNATSTSIDYWGTGAAVANVSGKTVTFTLAPSTTRTNTAVINNSYGVASFVVEKQLRGAGAAAFGQGDFVIHVHCEAESVVTYDADVTITGAGTATIDDLAAGSTCSAVETNFASTGADARVYRDGDGDVIAEGTTVAADSTNPRIVIENWYLTGEISVTKFTDGNAAAAYGAGPFEVELVCTRGAVTTTDTREILADETEVFSGLPRGAHCTLTESNDASATSSLMVAGTSTVAGGAYSFDVEVDNASLSDNQQQSPRDITITNTFELASLEISKTVDTAARDEDGTTIDYGYFPIAVDCTFESNPVYGTGYDATTPMRRSLATGTTWTIDGLPSGADCSVTETDVLGAASTTYSVNAGTQVDGTDVSRDLTPGETNAIEFVNSYETGSLELTKVVDGGARDANGDGSDVDADWLTGDFEVQVTCVLDTITVFDDSHTFTKDDASWTISNLATGALCTIDEFDDGEATATVIEIDAAAPVTGTTASVTIGSDADPIGVTVTNTFDLTSVNVTKVRDGDTELVTGDTGWDLWGEGPFEVTLECVFDGTDVVIPGGATRELTGSNGYTASFEGLPIGADCDFSETQNGGANASSVSDPTFTTTATPTAETVTNTFLLGDLAVSKSFIGLGSGEFGSGDFEVTLTCEREFNSGTEQLVLPDGGRAELTSAGGYAYTYRNLPVGAECSLEETKTGFSTAQYVGGPQTITDDATDPVSIELVNDFQLGTLSLQKSTFGPFAAGADGQVFDISVECWVDVDGVPTRITLDGGDLRSIRAGETTLIDDLPVNATCTFDEAGNGGADMGVYTLDGILQLSSTMAVEEGDADIDLTNMYVLAHTGTDPLIWIFAAMLSAGTGVVLVWRGRRRGAHV